MSQRPVSATKSIPEYGLIKLKTQPYLVLITEKLLIISFPLKLMMCGKPTLGLYLM